MEDVAGPTKKIVLEKRESTFGNSNGRVRSYQEEAAVEPELRSKLESIGMRTRFNVGRGYGSPPPSQSLDHFTNLDGSVFASNNEVLQSVKNSRSTWNRTKSAPLYNNELVPFCGLRADLIIQDENDDPNSSTPGGSNTPKSNEEINEVNEGIGLGDLKRNREDIFGDWATQEEEEQGLHSSSTMDLDSTNSTKPIAGLPRRNSPTYSSPTFGMNRVSARTMPVGAGLTSYLASGAQGTPWTTQDFSAFTNNVDF